MEKLNLEPGDFVVWDSRTMHHAAFPMGETIRCVQYVCMTPAKFAKPEDLKIKADLFNNFVGVSCGSLEFLD